MDVQAPQHKLAKIHRNTVVERFESERCHDVSSQVCLGLAERQRRIAMENFINEDSESPNVRLWTVYIIDKSLRTHIDWAANVDIFEAIPKITKVVPRPFCKAKIGYFCYSLVKEYICDFEISVYDVLVC